MNFNKLHAEELRQLTGCPYPTLVPLKRKLEPYFMTSKRGRPFKHTVWAMLVVTLIKLRGETAYRSLQIYLRMNFVTLHRYVNKVCVLIADMPFAKSERHRFLIVDGTCARVRSTTANEYSGYKHHKNRKVQIIVDDRKHIIAVSKCHPGSVHDKKIWDQEWNSIRTLLDKPILGDKGYAGGTGENTVLFRPIKHNELEFKNNKDSSRTFNRELSKWRVTVEHVFAQLKSFKILRGIFPLKATKFGVCVRAIAYIHNLNLEEVQRQIPIKR